MKKFLLSLVLLATSPLGPLGGQESRDESQVFEIKEEAAWIEYTATSAEAVVVFEAESETIMGSIEIRSPDGSSVLRIWAGGGQESRISGFVIETGETTAEQLFEHYDEGHYSMSALAADGRRATGGAQLSHELLPAPTVVYPEDGSVGVPLNATIRWIPDASAVEYTVVLEQDENDGLTARLPAGTSSFQIPVGILRSQTLSHVEVGAVAESGNTTLVEIAFFTL